MTRSSCWISIGHLKPRPHPLGSFPGLHVKAEPGEASGMICNRIRVEGLEFCVWVGVGRGIFFSAASTSFQSSTQIHIIRAETVHGNQDWEVARRKQVPLKPLERGRVWPRGIHALVSAAPGGQKDVKREGRRRNEPMGVTAGFPSTDYVSMTRWVTQT